MMYLIFFLSLLFCRVMAGYDSRFQKGKYIIIKNSILRILLLDKMSFYNRTNRLKKDLNKITVFGLLLYIYGLLTLFVATVLNFIVPKIPIESWVIETDKFIYNVDTLNEKLSAIFIWLFFLFVFVCLIIRIIKSTRTSEVKWLKILTYIICCFMILIAGICLFEVLRQLVICFI